MNLDSYKDKAKKTLDFFRITDESGLLSLTNVTMLLVIYKVSVAPVTSISDITALAIGVIGYQVKRAVTK